jgi:hypothetical protein
MLLSKHVHVPAILLSAFAEFSSARGARSRRPLILSHISEYDPRVVTSTWCQPMANAQLGAHSSKQQMNALLPSHSFSICSPADAHSMPGPETHSCVQRLL